MDEAREKFLDKIKTLSLTMGFEVITENDELIPQWKNTYKYLLTWCLVFKSNDPPEGIMVEKVRFLSTIFHYIRQLEPMSDGGISISAGSSQQEEGFMMLP